MSAAEERAIRMRERGRLASLLHENAETIANYTKDAESAVRLVALMIELEGVG